MMNTLTHTELGELLAAPADTAVSIFIPTFRAGRETEQSPIYLKNMLSEAEEQLREREMRTPDIAALLEPARKLIDDPLFWSEQSEGLALFLTAAGLRSFRLPLHFEPLAVVGERFYIKPLLPLLAADGRYTILALSQNEVRLLRGTQHTVEELDLEGAPGSLAEALRFDDPESTLQFHAATNNPSGPDGRSPIYHGQGVGTGDEKENLLRYFHKLDAGLAELLHDERAPLVVAGVDYLLPIYAEANTYPYLVGEGVAGNPEEWSAAELQERAWAVVEPFFAQGREKAEARFRQLDGQGSEQAARDLTEIAAAAANGRVETLFVATGVQRWGTFDAAANTATWHDQPQAGDQDLLDFAAMHTLTNSGTVYALDPQEMPVGSTIAAILRY
jgi:hypothetical protein